MRTVGGEVLATAQRHGERVGGVIEGSLGRNTVYAEEARLRARYVDSSCAGADNRVQQPGDDEGRWLSCHHRLVGAKLHDQQIDHA